MARNLACLGALPEKLVWHREGAVAPKGRPSDPFLAFCGELSLGWVILEAGDWSGQVSAAQGASRRVIGALVLDMAFNTRVAVELSRRSPDSTQQTHSGSGNH